MDKRTDKRTDVVIREIHLHDLRMPLIEPYPSAITTIEALETMVIEVHGSDGSVGFGEAAIVEGYTHETREGGWRFCREHAARAIGQAFAPTKTALLEHRADHSPYRPRTPSLAFQSHTSLFFRHSLSSGGQDRKSVV